MSTTGYLIAENFTSEDYKGLLLDNYPHEDWNKAVNAFKNRFHSRFFSPLAALSGSPSSHDAVNGFIILSCIFILVETLGGFREGVGDHSGQSKQLFTKGLEGLIIVKDNETSSDATEDQKVALYRTGRCAILHTAGTENIKVRSSGPAIKQTDNESFEINRNEFLNWIKARFDSYATELLEEQSAELRGKFRAKMDYISGKLN